MQLFLLLKKFLFLDALSCIKIFKQTYTFWGVDKETGVGENNLGKILMEVRANLNNLDVEILSGENVILTRFTVSEKTACGHLNFTQKFEIESKNTGEILNCQYRVRGKNFIADAKSKKMSS